MSKSSEEISIKLKIRFVDVPSHGVVKICSIVN